jgi:hypothetical protein
MSGLTHSGIATERFRRHRLLRPGPADAADVVGWFGAVQAQDYRATRWALALRMRGSTPPADIDAAFAAGEILRTHVMRPTWHFVARGDIRWLLELTAPRVHQALAFGRKYYELSDALQRRAASVIEMSRRTHCSMAARHSRRDWSAMRHSANSPIDICAATVPQPFAIFRGGPA